MWGIITIMNIPCQQLAGYSKLLVSEFTEVVDSVNNVICQYNFIAYMYCLCILLHCPASGVN